MPGRAATAPARDRVWLAIAAGALLTVAAILVLGGPLGKLTVPDPLDLLPDPLVTGGLIMPEPTELARFVIAVIGAIAVAAWVAYGPARRLGRLAGTARVAAAVGPYAVLAFVAVAWATRSEPAWSVDRDNYFSALAGLAAVGLAALAVWLARRRTPAAGSGIGRLIALLRRRPIAATLAVLATVCFLLPGVFTDNSLGNGMAFIVIGHLPALFADFTAVGNGATPGVDFASQYSSLLPYVLAPFLSLTDYSPASFTVFANLASALALLALWRALVLLARDELAGLALYLPVLALSVVPLTVDGAERLANNSQYQILPERYLMPCVILWVLARHLRGIGPRRQEAIFFLAGLAVVNNPEFGTANLAAAFIALALAAPEGPSLRALPGLIARAALGLVAAFALVVALDLIRSGSLPSVELLTYYVRLFGSQGFALVRMPTLGLHLALYATFAGALVLAAALARRGDADRIQVGLLGYAGLFGLVAGGYYAGRSVSYSLIGLFPAWGLALAVLAWWVWRRLRSAPGLGAALRGAGPLGLAALVGLGLAATTVIQVAAPWDQIQRLAADSDKVTNFELGPVEDFVAANTDDGQPVAWIGEDGSLVARAAGVRNVDPIGDAFHVIATEQLDYILERLADEGGDTVITYDPPTTPLRLHVGITDYLGSHGFAPVARSEPAGLVIWQPAAG